jgi:hypothetical protein
MRIDEFDGAVAALPSVDERFDAAWKENAKERTAPKRVHQKRRRDFAAEACTSQSQLVVPA